MTYILLANPLGVILGYGLCACLLENIGWRFAFYIQSFCLIPSYLGVLMIP
jgi:predicted MFS family arabinose efflux permease